MTYVVAGWNENFENNRTRELKYLSWVPMPNKMDGDGYTELLAHPDGAAHFGAWCALVEVASRCDPRGTLLRDGARPHDFASLERITRIRSEVWADAMPRLITIGWITVSEIPQDGAGIPQDDAALEERNGTERNGTEGSAPQADAPRQPAPDETALRMLLTQYEDHNPGAEARRFARERLESLLRAFSQEQIQEAIRAGPRGEKTQGVADRLNGIQGRGENGNGRKGDRARIAGDGADAFSGVATVVNNDA